MGLDSRMFKKGAYIKDSETVMEVTRIRVVGVGSKKRLLTAADIRTPEELVTFSETDLEKRGFKYMRMRK